MIYVTPLFLHLGLIKVMMRLKLPAFLDGPWTPGD